MNQNPSHYPPVLIPDQPIHHLPIQPPHQHTYQPARKSAVELDGEKDGTHEDVRSLMAATANMVEETVAAARKRLDAALASGGEFVHRMEDKALEGAKSTDKVLHEHPYPALAIALGVGVFIGWLAAHHDNQDRGWFS